MTRFVQLVKASGASLDTTAHVMERAGSRIHAWTSGAADGPLIAFSHGATMDHRMFDAQVAAVAAAGYLALTWDIRAHGRSKPLGRTPITIPDLAADLLALLDEIGHRGPLCLVGQSLGGFIAQRVAYDHPERVAALVMVGSTSITAPLARWERWALRSSPWWLRLWPAGDLQRRTVRAAAVGPGTRAYVEEAMRQLTRHEFMEVWRAVAGAMHPDPDYRIEQPLLLTHGDQDRTGTVARSAPRWAAREPRCRYEVIPAASHLANQDNPAVFNRVLLEFLGEHYPADMMA